MKSDYLIILHFLLQFGALGTFMYANCDFDDGMKCYIVVDRPTPSTPPTVGPTPTATTTAETKATIPTTGTWSNYEINRRDSARVGK